MRWRGHGDGYGNPARSFEITNNIERWGLSKSPVYAAPKVLANGQKLQSFRIQGRFFEPLNLIDYPLDEQTLTINIEDVSAAAGQRVYVPDEADSGTDPKAILPGWQIQGSEVTVDDHLYQTDFGETGSDAAKRTYSAATFGLSIARPGTFFAWKLLLPLIIVVLLGGSVLLIHPSLIEVRIAAPATALLSMVFLQQGYSDTLPQIGSLVLLDKIYALAYGLIIFLMAAVIYTAYKFRTTGDDVALMALDRKLAVGAISVFAGGSLLLVLAERRLDGVGELALAGPDRRLEPVLRRGERTRPARVVRARRVVGVVEVEGENRRLVEREIETAGVRALDRVGEVATGAVGLVRCGGVAEGQEEIRAVAVHPEQGQLAPRRADLADPGVGDDPVLATRVDREVVAFGGGAKLALDPGAVVEGEVVEAGERALLLRVQRRRRMVAEQHVPSRPERGNRPFAAAPVRDVELGDPSPPVS